MLLTIYEQGRQSYTVNLEEFHKDTISFGRHPESDIVMHPDFVSRIHGCIYQENGQWYIEDVGSTYGLYCNGQRIMRMALHDGVQLVIPYGNYELQMFFSETQENHQSAGYVYGTIPQDQYGVQNPVHSKPELYDDVRLYDSRDPYGGSNDTWNHQSGSSDAGSGSSNVGKSAGKAAKAGKAAAGAAHKNRTMVIICSAICACLLTVLVVLIVVGVRRQKSGDKTTSSEIVSEEISEDQESDSQEEEKTTASETTETAEYAPLYLEVLQANEEKIRGYSQHRRSLDDSDVNADDLESKTIAMEDITGDGVPELIYFALQDRGEFEDYDSAALCIYTIEDGQAKQIFYGENWDVQSGGGNAYCLFQIGGEATLYGFNGWADSAIAEYYYRFDLQTDGSLAMTEYMSRIEEYNDDHSDMTLTCTVEGNVVDENGFQTKLDDWISHMTRLLNYNQSAYDDNMTAMMKTSEPCYLSYDEAFAQLSSNVASSDSESGSADSENSDDSQNSEDMPDYGSDLVTDDPDRSRDVWIESMETTCSVHAPHINYDTSVCGELNQEISDYVDNCIWDIENGNTATAYIKYEWHVYKDALSIVISTDDLNATCPQFKVYNVNLAENKRLSGDELVAYLGMTHEEYIQKFKTALDPYAQNYSANFDDVYTATMSEDNLEKSEPYIGSGDCLYAVIGCYTMADPSYYMIAIPVCAIQ